MQGLATCKPDSFLQLPFFYDGFIKYLFPSHRNPTAPLNIPSHPTASHHHSGIILSHYIIKILLHPILSHPITLIPSSRTVATHHPRLGAGNKVSCNLRLTPGLTSVAIIYNISQAKVSTAVTRTITAAYRRIFINLFSNAFMPLYL
ncbi:hypothetical protein E2C01_102689 [Portunus trituberculatus]|uniref:Uncharacterized protein n=1 Tax=Portunus trituberculatus TaxID=210409 RepID=A0A5B7KN57_PORTR|nr:hypothetical protein [Portunus trituberculatus]